MTASIQPIRKLAKANTDFRREVATGRHAQVVVMCLLPGEDIGEEVHAGHDQFFRIEAGQGEVLIDGARHPVKADDAVIVPGGAGLSGQL